MIGVPVPLVAVQILWVNLRDRYVYGDSDRARAGRGAHDDAATDQAALAAFSKFMLTRIVLTASVIAALALSLYLVFINFLRC